MAQVCVGTPICAGFWNGTSFAVKDSRKPFLHAGPGWEAKIRALSVSLLAVAAIAASLLITRSRDEEAAPSTGEKQPVRQSLDAIRAAGL
jgi:hypothetical protein